MVEFAKTALLLLLYPVLYLRLPLTLKWFSVSIAGLAAFVILLTNLRDLSSASVWFSQTGAPLLAYWGGYAMAGAVLLLNYWIERSYPRARPLKAVTKATIAELESLARSASARDIELSVSALSEREKPMVVFGAYLADSWAVFEWFIPGRKPADARVLVRSTVELQTKRVLVETSPAPTKHPGIANSVPRAILASIAVAVVWTLVGAIFVNQRIHEWPGTELLGQMFFRTWLVCLVYFALTLLRFRSLIPVRLPSNDLLYVERRAARGR